MARNWAIAVGVNQYLHMQPLHYAKQDAAGVRDFLTQDAKFDQVYYFADDSEDVILDGATVATQPTCHNLKQFLEVRFATPFLQTDDTLWFFFHGHGLHYANQDYLLLSDSEPEAAEHTALSMEWVTHCLRRSGTQNVVLVLDACHTEEQKFGQGFGTDPEGVITLFSADFNETASEVAALEQGAFAHVLLDGLRFYGKHRSATLSQLVKYMRDRLPKISHHFHLPSQSPRLRADIPQLLDTFPLPQTQAHKQVSPTLRLRLASAVAVGLSLVAYLGYQAMVPSNSASSSANASSSDAAVRNVANAADDSAGSSKRPGGALNAETLDHNLKTGTYYAITAEHSNSRREIARTGDRLCMKLVDGPTDQNSSTKPTVMVTSLSVRGDGLYIDATQERLKLDSAYAEFTDRRSVWQLLENKVDRSGTMAECLTAKERYVNQRQGES